MRELLRRYQVVPLLSPPGMPHFNGTVEAGIGSLKVRAHHIADRRGRPWQWTSDDVEGARLQANQTARPRGHNAPTPDETWAGSGAVLADERNVLQETLRMELNHRTEPYRSEVDHDILWLRNDPSVASATCRQAGPPGT